MAYVTGTAANAADIVTAVRNACTANGWTLTNDILSKGTCFVRLWSPSAGFVSVHSGTGQTGGAGSTLTGTSSQAAAGIGGTIGTQAFTFPMTYHIHVLNTPDEVYVMVNYAVNYYQRIMFGQSNVAGLSGSGNFYEASRQSSPGTISNNYDMRISPGVGSTDIRTLPFTNYPGYVNDSQGVDHSLDAPGTWGGVRGCWALYQLYVYNPSLWNGESVLVPFRCTVVRSGFYSVVLEPAHLRYCPMDNVDPEQVLTIGTDKWKVYPAIKKGTRAGFNTNATNSGESSVYGIAIRYDGP